MQNIKNTDTNTKKIYKQTTYNGAKLRFKGVRFKNMKWTTYMMNL